MTEDRPVLDIGPLSGPDLIGALLSAIGHAGPAKLSTVVVNTGRPLAVIIPPDGDEPVNQAEMAAAEWERAAENPTLLRATICRAVLTRCAAELRSAIGRPRRGPHDA